MTEPLSQEELDRRLDEAYRQYVDDVDRLSQQAQWDIQAIWQDEYTFPTPESRVEEVRATLSRYSDRAAERAQRYYDLLREQWRQQGVDMSDYQIPDLPDPNRIVWQLAGGSNNTDYPGLHYRDVIPDADGRVHNEYGLTIDDLWPGGDDVDTYLKYARAWVKSASRTMVMDNVKADSSNPRWARVPRGKTCEFCVMLASRGWVYLTEETASLGGSFHNGHCDCDIVPNWGRQKLTGYDPDKLYERYKRCADSAARLTSTKAYERYIDAFTPKSTKDEPLAYDKWKRNIELAEMRTRSRDWLNGGDPPEIDFRKTRERMERTEPRDLFVVETLAENGFELTTREENAPDGYSNIDLLIRTNLWEIKSPNGSNDRSVESNLRSAKRQFAKNWPTPENSVRVVFNGVNYKKDDDWIADELECQADAHDIASVLFIRKDGSVLRIK